MSIKKIPRWHDQESTPEPASPFLSEELFTTAADSPEERTTGHTWYQSESPFLYAFELNDQEAMIAQEAEAYEVDTDGEALAEDAVGELAGEEAAADTDFSPHESEEGAPEAWAELEDARDDGETNPTEEEEFEESARHKPMEEPLRGAGDTRELTHLGLLEYQVAPPVQTIKVPRWSRSLSVPVIRVTLGATPTKAIEGPEKQGVHLLAFDTPMRMGIRAGEGGEVDIKVTIEYKGHEKPPLWSKVAQARRVIQMNLPFSCTPEGDIRLERDRLAGGRLPQPNEALSVDIQVYQRRDKPKNRPRPGIPPSVWEAWMKQVCILRIAIIVKLTVSENGPGWYSVTFNDGSVPIPAPIKDYATSDRTAQLDPMTIDLVPEGARPPLETPKGLAHQVYFRVGSSKIDTTVNEGPKEGSKHQGNVLDAWIRDHLMAHWDVRETLLRGMLPVRGEARASATFKGKDKAQLLPYNLKLSKERRDAVVNRLRRTIAALARDLELPMSQFQITPIGARDAPKLGEEIVAERRVLIIINSADIDKAIKELSRVNRYWWEQ